MVERKNLLKRYTEARVALAMVIGFILFDSVSLAIVPNAPMLFVVVVPQIAIAIARFYFEGFQAILLIILFVVFPLLLNIICFILSKEHHDWLYFAGMMLVLDMLGLATFIYIYGFETKMIIDIFVEFCFIYYIFRGSAAGRKLADDFSEPIEEQKSQDDKVITVSSYCYDEEMAKANKTEKGGLLFVAIIGLVILLVIDFFLLGFVDTYGNLSVLGLTAVAVGLLIGSLLLYVFVVVKLSPYTTAKSVQYFLLDDEVCRCIRNDGRTIEKLYDLKIISKKESEFICQYKTKTGKQRKLIIPNCYPGIEAILKK